MALKVGKKYSETKSASCPKIVPARNQVSGCWNAVGAIIFGVWLGIIG